VRPWMRRYRLRSRYFLFAALSPRRNAGRRGIGRSAGGDDLRLAPLSPVRVTRRRGAARLSDGLRGDEGRLALGMAAATSNGARAAGVGGRAEGQLGA